MVAADWYLLYIVKLEKYREYRPGSAAGDVR